MDSFSPCFLIKVVVLRSSCMLHNARASLFMHAFCNFIESNALRQAFTSRQHPLHFSSVVVCSLTTSLSGCNYFGMAKTNKYEVGVGLEVIHGARPVYILFYLVSRSVLSSVVFQQRV